MDAGTLFGLRPPLLTTEVLPPDRGDLTTLLEAARSARSAGAGAIFFPDAPGGRARVDAVTAAGRVKEALGGPCIPHLNCRDRNLVALEGALLSCLTLGLDGVKAVTGDPVPGDLGRGVYDLDSTGLTELARRRAGDAFAVVVGHGIGHSDPARAEDRLRQKIAAGARAVVTTPVLDPDVLLGSLDRLGPLQVPLLVSVVLIPSAEVLEFLVNEMPSFRVPRDLHGRLHRARNPEEAQQCGLEAALAVARAVRGRVQGFHVVPPFGRWQGAVPLLRALM